MTELCKRVLASNLSAEDKVAILNALMGNHEQIIIPMKDL
jgi:hypothetical protein